MVRQSYKEKWQAALRQRTDNPVADVTLSAAPVAESSRLTTDLNLTLQQISSVNGEVVAAARDLVESLDEVRTVAGIEYGEVFGEIDGKTAQLPVRIALRRVRDVLKISEARIAMLAIHAEELYEANQKYKVEIARLNSGNLLATRTLIDCAWIGPRSTEAEREDYREQVADYTRFGLHYEDIDDQWITQHLTTGTVLKQPNHSINGDEDDSSDSESESRAMTVSANRRAVITPQSPTRTRFNKHVDLQ